MDLPQAILFDLDGVLIDTEPLLANAWRETAKEHNHILTQDNLEELRGIILESNISPFLQYRKLFLTEDIALDVDDKAVSMIAEKCHSQDIGARGIKNYFDKALKETIYNIKSLKNKGLIGIKITVDTVDNNKDPKYNYANG